MSVSDQSPGSAMNPVLERFMGFVSPEPNSGCWLWDGCTNSQGYGRFNLNKRNSLAHRTAYGLFVGPIADGMTIDHLCRVRCCVNPKHLEVVTHQENVARAIVLKTHCVNGHEFTAENTIQKPKQRACRECTKESWLKIKMKAYANNP